jgi:hypothetical protein
MSSRARGEDPKVSRGLELQLYRMGQSLADQSRQQHSALCRQARPNHGGIAQRWVRCHRLCRAKASGGTNAGTWPAGAAVHSSRVVCYPLQDWPDRLCAGANYGDVECPANVNPARTTGPGGRSAFSIFAFRGHGYGLDVFEVPSAISGPAIGLAGWSTTTTSCGPTWTGGQATTLGLSVWAWCGNLLAGRFRRALVMTDSAMADGAGSHAIEEQRHCAGDPVLTIGMAERPRSSKGILLRLTGQQAQHQPRR